MYKKRKGKGIYAGKNKATKAFMLKIVSRRRKE